VSGKSKPGGQTSLRVSVNAFELSDWLRAYAVVQISSIAFFNAPLVESPVPVQPEPSPAQEMTPAMAAAERRKKFKNHDPYRLPELPEGALTATRSNPSTNGGRPDPRMATEEELVHFIEEMKPGVGLVPLSTC
jgi:hypothetical protein